MKQQTLLALFLLTISFAQAQSEANMQSAMLWRGFSHSWTYNHRINRLGNYVSSLSGSPISCHTAASGLGADSCFYTSYYSQIESPLVNFHEGVLKIKLYGKEKQLINKTVEVAIPATENMKNQEQYVTLLNGFDLRAIGQADKLQFLRFSIEDAYYAPAVNELRFKVNVSVVVNCQSFECSRFNQKTTYDLDIYYLIIAGEHNHLAATSHNITENYPWDRKIESTATPKQRTVNGDKEYLHANAAVGIKSLAVTLDEAHWLLQYHCNVTPLEYVPEFGKASISTDLFFQEWQQGMKQMSAMPQQSKFSSKKKGWCVLDSEIVLLQFRSAKVQHQKMDGSGFWEGKNASPDAPEAKHTHVIKFD